MGNLPPFRINQLKSFSCSGVDFAGPISTTASKLRGAKVLKSYICIFVCCATKAIHLELVSDLSSDAFIAALRRFVSRRGRCSVVLSDRGTNFVGASRELLKLMKSALQTEKITFSFNPPLASHMGGLWERGVRSVKSHLIRVIGTQILTFEETYTVLTQIEAILNSRPLCPISSDPTDLSVLSPGHFLTLEPLSALPDADLSHLTLNRLSRWQLVQKMQADFWKRWHNEYLNTLQQRNKWYSNASNITTDTLVLIKEDNVPPIQWRIGRVVETYPGKDGICRVVKLRTSRGFFKRPVTKLAPLPLKD